MTTIARVPISAQIVITDSQDNAICNFEVTRGPDGRVILHAMGGEQIVNYTDLTITAKSITVGVVPGGDPNNGHVYYLSMDGGDLVFAPDKPIRFRPTAELDLWPQDEQGNINNMEIGSQVPRDARVSKLAIGSGSMTGTTFIPAAATDLASALTLLNAMRQVFRERGDLV
jgi:hypothetical protein